MLRSRSTRRSFHRCKKQYELVHERLFAVPWFPSVPQTFRCPPLSLWFLILVASASHHASEPDVSDVESWTWWTWSRTERGSRKSNFIFTARGKCWTFHSAIRSIAFCFSFAITGFEKRKECMHPVLVISCLVILEVNPADRGDTIKSIDKSTVSALVFTSESSKTFLTTPWCSHKAKSPNRSRSAYLLCNRFFYSVSAANPAK